MRKENTYLDFDEPLLICDSRLLVDARDDLRAKADLKFFAFWGFFVRRFPALGKDAALGRGQDLAELGERLGRARERECRRALAALGLVAEIAEALDLGVGEQLRQRA